MFFFTQSFPATMPLKGEVKWEKGIVRREELMIADCQLTIISYSPFLWGYNLGCPPWRT